MGKSVKKIGSGLGSIGKAITKPVSNFVKNPIPTIAGAAGGALVGGPVGSFIGAAGGNLLGGGGFLGGDEEIRQISSTGLNPLGQQQFQFAGNQLQGLLGQTAPQAGGGNFEAAQGAFNSINFGGIDNAIGRLSGFSGTQAAKNALNQVGAFKGTADAFRTLGALERFGRAEQGFVTDARNAVLSFDKGFQSEALPLLRQAAEGQFLTEQGGNPFIRDLINTAQRPVVENFREQVLPGILSTFAGSGGVGSSLRAAFTAQQARDLQRNLGDISTTIGFNVFESERNKQLAAQQAILGFEDQGLNRQLAARTTNLNAAQTTAAQLLAARQAAGTQATNLSQQRLAALQAQASGQVSLSAQRQAALAAALQGRLGAGQLQVSRGQGLAGIAGQQQALNIANAQLRSQRVNQLLQLQENAEIAGTTSSENFIKPGLF